MIEVPQSVYTVPTEAEVEINPVYWTAYTEAQNNPVPVPSPAGLADYAAYWDIVRSKRRPVLVGGAVSTTNAGFNARFNDAANWTWKNDPDSPFRKATG